jgi:hypothetical protein
MKKSVILVGIIIIILLAIAAFFIFSPRGLSNEEILANPQSAIQFCQESSQDKQTDCYFQLADVLAVNNSDVALQACSAMSNENNKKGCIEDLASKQENQTTATEICNSMKEDTRFREHCYGTILANSENLNTDTQLLMCDSKTGMDQNNCYRGLSESFWLSNISKSIEVCNKISEKSSKDSCLNSIIGNPEIVQANPNLSVSICDAITLKSNCYNYVAQTISGSNPKTGAVVCQKLSDDTQMLNCYHVAWFDFKDIVLQNYDFTISLCNKLTIKRDECLRGASEIFMTTDKTKAEAICRLASSSTTEGCLHVIQTSQ